jgi:hypothetical protein
MLGVSASAPGADVAYTLMPYRPWYPALHLEASLDSTAGDARFDDSGERRDSAVQGLDRRSAFPRREARLALAWTFPLFEQEALPFVSRRLHTARLRTAYVDLDADGGIAAFVDARPRLQSPQSGLGDVELEFGTWLSGSSGWRQGQVDALSTLLLFGLRLPVGVADVDAPASAGTRALAASLKLGAHAAIWRGATIDAGLGWRVHARNPEPMFGACTPCSRPPGRKGRPTGIAIRDSPPRPSRTPRWRRIRCRCPACTGTRAPTGARRAYRCTAL